MKSKSLGHPEASIRRTRARFTPTTRLSAAEFRTSNNSMLYDDPFSNRTSVSVLHARATKRLHFALDRRTTCKATHPLTAHRSSFVDAHETRSMLKHPSALSSINVPAHMLSKSANPLEVKTLQLSNVKKASEDKFVRHVLISSVNPRRDAHLLSNNVSHLGAKMFKISIDLHPAALTSSTDPDCT